jgi:hypothetical protein
LSIVGNHWVAGLYHPLKKRQKRPPKIKAIAKLNRSSKNGML